MKSKTWILTVKDRDPPNAVVDALEFESQYRAMRASIS
jgi:hypothetical protein